MWLHEAREVSHSATEAGAKETMELSNPITDDEDPFMGNDDEDFGVEMEEDKTIILDDD